MRLSHDDTKKLPANIRAKLREVNGEPGIRSKRNKFNAKGVRHEDGYFHSQAELARWLDLKTLQRAGKIDRLERQVKRSLSVNGKHIADIVIDFLYFEIEDGYAKAICYEDKKGVVTPEWALKAKLFAALYGQEIKLS